MAQAKIAAAEAQPVRAVQSSFDFEMRSAKARAHFFAWHAAAVAIPGDAVIVGHLATHAHT